MDNKELQEFKDKLIVGMQHVFKLAAEGIAAYEKPAVTHYTGLPKPTHYSVSEGDPWQEWKTVIIERGFTANVQRVHAIKFEGGAIFDMVNGWRSLAGAEEDRKVGGQINTERLVPRYQTAQCDCGRFEGDCRRGEECGRNPTPRYEDMGQPIQQQGQDAPSIPDCAYYSKGNFYSHLTGHGMSQVFFNAWFDRRHEFPKEQIVPELRRLYTDQRVVSRALLEECYTTLIGKLRQNEDQEWELCYPELVEKLKAALATEKSELSDPPIDVSRGAMWPCRNYEPNGFYGSICAKCGWPCAEHSK